MIRSISQVRSLVAAFESGNLRPFEWTHGTRLVLGLWYVLDPCGRRPLEAMRRGITLHESRDWVSLTYHERTTAFYLRKIEAFAVAAPATLGFVELANALLSSRLANRKMHLVPPMSAARTLEARRASSRPFGFRRAQVPDLSAGAKVRNLQSPRFFPDHRNAETVTRESQPRPHSEPRQRMALVS